MAVTAAHWGRPRSAVFVVGAVAVAAAIGVVAVVSPILAIAAAVGGIAVPAAVLRPKLVVHLLVVSIYAEALAIGGVTVGRLVAPLALIAVASQLVNAPARLSGARTTLRFVGAYTVMAAVSLIWTASPDGTLFALGSLAIALVYMAAFAVLVRDLADVRKLLWTVTISAVVLGLWWIGSYAAGVDRFSTGAGDPNFLAAFQAIAIPLVLVLAASTRDGAVRAALYGAIAIIAASVIATLSRGGSLTLLAEVLALAAIPSAALFRSRARKAAFFLVAGFALVMFLSVAGGALSQRFQIGFAQTNIAGSRGDLWMAAWHGYRQHPVFGLGYGGFKAESFQLLSETPGVNLPFHLAFRLRPGEYVHNAYLGTLTELGPLGLFLFGGILVATATSLIRTSRRARAAGEAFLRSVANGLLVGLLAFVVASMLLSSETARTLWLIIGLSLALPSMVPTGDAEGEAA